MEKIVLLQTLAKEGKEKEFRDIYKTLTDDEKKDLEKLGEFVNVQGHHYQGFNLFFLSVAKKPGVFGTFKQFKNLGRKVKKGSKGVGLLCPIFKDKDNTEISFFKTIYVFHIDDTEVCEK